MTFKLKHILFYLLIYLDIIILFLNMLYIFLNTILGDYNIYFLIF